MTEDCNISDPADAFIDVLSTLSPNYRMSAEKSVISHLRWFDPAQNESIRDFNLNRIEKSTHDSYDFKLRDD